MPVALPASRRWKFGSATIQPESNYINSITEYVSISTNMHLISFSILLIQVAAYALYVIPIVDIFFWALTLLTVPLLLYPSTNEQTPLDPKQSANPKK